MKGNEDTIESKLDFLYKLIRTNELTTLTVKCARDANVKIGQDYCFYDKDYLTNLIKDELENEPNISLRDLKRKHSKFANAIDELNGYTFRTIEQKSSSGKGQPKQVVHLI
jgi:hypothetical protein